jgi:hypothetical protein
VSHQHLAGLFFFSNFLSHLILSILSQVLPSITAWMWCSQFSLVPASPCCIADEAI